MCVCVCVREREEQKKMKKKKPQNGRRHMKNIVVMTNAFENECKKWNMKGQ